MTAGVMLGLLALAGGADGVPRDSVYGLVRDAVSGAVLAGVAVEAAPRTRAVTDDRGAYVLASPEPGSHSLHFTRPGFEPFSVDVAVPAGRSLRLDIGLNPLPVTLPPISVSTPPAAGRPDSGREVEIGLRRYTPAALRTDPLVSPDDPLLAAAAGQSAEAQAGTVRAPRVRGGSADQNLVLLDGLPVYGLAHVGGSAGVFDPDLLGRVDLHTDVPPAAYGGRLSSIIAVDLRPADTAGVRLAGAWNALAVRQSLSAPLGSSGTLQAAVRRSYRGIFPGDLRSGEQNGFGDALVHASLRGSRDRLSAYLVDGSDHLAFEASLGAAAAARPANGFDWSHRTVGLVWRHATGPRHALTVRAWQARADASIAWTTGGADERVTSALSEPGMSVDLSPVGAGRAPMFGLSVSRPRTSYVLARTGDGTTLQPDSSTLRLASAPWLASAYGQGSWRIGRSVELAAGLRAEAVGLRTVLLEPRVSTRLDVARGVSVLVGYGRTHQFVQSLRNEESPLDYAVGAELPLAVGTAGLRPARADQLSAEVAVRPDGHSRARLYAYARSLRDILAVPVESSGPFARAEVPSGRGTARGLEAELIRNGARVDLHVVLGAESARRIVGGGSYVPGMLRSRWLVGGVGYHFDDRTVGRLSGAVAAGAPTTPVTGDAAWDSPGILAVGEELVGSPETVGALNRDRLPTYWRLDAGVVRDWRLRALGGFGVLTSSVTLANLLDTRNPLAFAAGATGVGRALNFPSRTLDVQLGWRF